MSQEQKNVGLTKVGEIIEVIDEGDTIEIVEIEEYAKAGKKPPKAKKYRIRIDKEKFEVSQQLISGTELLKLVQKTPAEWRIYQKVHGQMHEVQPSQEVDLGAPGTERFTTIERAQGDGEQGTVIDAPLAQLMRRQFDLPEEDITYLDGLGLSWEAIIEAEVCWLLIHNHPMPDGYNHSTVIMAIRIEKGYPPGTLDMVYLYPPLARRDGKGIIRIENQQLEGKTFQRWSRHYNWREGTDTLASHHIRIKNWIAAELSR